MVVEPTRRLFTIEEFELMAEAGVFGPDERIELIEGEIVLRPSANPPHAGTVNRLNRLFTRLLGDRVVVAVQNPTRLPPRSMPVPDVCVLRDRDDFYATSHPEATDVLLLIEVADTTLRFDRTKKIPMYARRGIREAWLVDLGAGTLEVYRDPGPDGYRTKTVLGPREEIRPELIDDIVVSVDEILGA
jgi:Uma2 family endonuclease